MECSRDVSSGSTHYHFQANAELVLPHRIRSDVQRRISCGPAANSLRAWQQKSPIGGSPRLLCAIRWISPSRLANDPIIENHVNACVFFCFFSHNLSPPGLTVGALWRLLKAGLEPFGTSGWQPAWKLKHIPPLSKLGLAAATLHTHDHTHIHTHAHTETRSCCGLAVTWAGW